MGLLRNPSQPSSATTVFALFSDLTQDAQAAYTTVREQVEAEVLIGQGQTTLIRRAQPLSDLLALELGL